MKHSYTTNSLVSFLYGECSIFTKLEVEHWLSENQAINQEYETLKTTLWTLPKVSFKPAKRSIENILHFSKHNCMPAC